MVTINPATGGITDVNPRVGGTASEVNTLAFSGTGALYGAATSLYTVDTTTGALTLVGALNPPIFVGGMAFVTAAPPAGPIVSLTPPNFAFGSQQIGTTTVAQPLTLQNTGTGVLNITSIVASGDFAQTNTCGASLAASASCTINVTFTPTAAGVRSGSVIVTSNAPGSPHTSSLSGTGITTPPPPPSVPSAPIPTLSQWALIALAISVAYLALARFNKRAR
ncbi:MAG TPA: choice-of-anchor D domain-containing protein [Casimicrobiaceae bacterium]